MQTSVKLGMHTMNQCLYDLYKALFANIIGRLLYIPPITTGVGAGMHHPTNSNYVGEAFYNRRRFDDFN